MANIKSAKKRILVNRTKAARNKAIKSGVKTAVKKVNAAIAANDKAAAQQELIAATSDGSARLLPRAFITKIRAARKVSRLAQAVNKMA